MQKVALLITTRNGSEALSREALERCHRQTDPLEAGGRYSFSIFTNPDSPDGRQKLWTTASKEGFSFYIWMDEDLRLREGAFSALMENSEFLRHSSVVVGTVVSTDGQLLFGGRTKHGRLVEPDPTIPVPCYFYDLKLAMIPDRVFSKLENPSAAFKQGVLDYGFGDKVVKAGVTRVVAPGILAETDTKASLPEWRKPENPSWKKVLTFLRAVCAEVVRTCRSVFK